MGTAVCSEATIYCDMCTGTGVLTATMNEIVMFTALHFVTMNDAVSETNISSMILCISEANPITAAETAAASGVLTPGECTPVPTGIWLGANELVSASGMFLLDAASTCICSYGGEIIVTVAGCETVIIP